MMTLTAFLRGARSRHNVLEATEARARTEGGLT